MFRQNFLSKESFVAVTEKQAREAILSVPVFAPGIKLLVEDKVVQSIRFSYTRPLQNWHYHVFVSVLPLNDQYTRISLHAVYANGKVINYKRDFDMVLQDFEEAIKAAISGDITSYIPFQPKEAITKKLKNLINILGTFISVFSLRKKLS